MLDIRASLRVYAKGVNIEYIREIFDCVEDFGYSQGEQIRGSSSATHDITLWGKESELPQSEDLGAHIQWLLEFIKSRSTKLNAISEKSGVRPDIICSLLTDNGQGGASVPYEVIKEMGMHEIDLILEV